MTDITTLYLGIDIGGTKCGLVLADDQANILGRERIETRPLDRPAEETIALLLAGARAMVENRRASEGELALEGIGVSCGALLDPARRVLVEAPNLPGWRNIPLVDLLEQSFGCPAVMDNDANACAVAEHRFGAGRGVDNMVFLTFGTGIGAGLILGGRLYSGSRNLAGEFGHIRIADEGPIAYGKKGSIEAFASGTGIALLAQAAIESGEARARASSLGRLAEAGAGITAKEVVAAADEGDALAIELLGRAGSVLGRGIAILIDLLNPDLVVIGSIFARAERFLREAMESEIAREALPASRAACRIVPASLGESLGDFAAIALAMECGS